MMSIRFFLQYIFLFFILINTVQTTEFNIKMSKDESGSLYYILQARNSDIVKNINSELGVGRTVLQLVSIIILNVNGERRQVLE